MLFAKDLKPGDRVETRMGIMRHEPATVTHVDELGYVHIKWDSGGEDRFPATMLYKLATPTS